MTSRIILGICLSIYVGLCLVGSLQAQNPGAKFYMGYHMGTSQSRISGWEEWLRAEGLTGTGLDQASHQVLGF